MLWSSSQLIVGQIFVSSALYKARFVFGSSPSGRSLINNTNSIGPNIDPCGTPDSTGFTEDYFTRKLIPKLCTKSSTKANTQIEI